jgi:hypothetical protein
MRIPIYGKYTDLGIFFEFSNVSSRDFSVSPYPPRIRKWAKKIPKSELI